MKTIFVFILFTISFYSCQQNSTNSKVTPKFFKLIIDTTQVYKIVITEDYEIEFGEPKEKPRRIDKVYYDAQLNRIGSELFVDNNHISTDINSTKTVFDTIGSDIFRIESFFTKNQVIKNDSLTELLTEKKYDKWNNLISDIHKENSVIVFKTINKIGNDHKVEQSLFFNSNGTLESKRIYKRTKNGKLIEEMYSSKNWAQKREKINKFNKNNKIVSSLINEYKKTAPSSEWEKVNIFSRKNIYRYDKNSNLIEVKEVFTDKTYGQSGQIERFKYDERGNKIERKYYNILSNGELELLNSNKYKYDKFNNLIESKSFHEYKGLTGYQKSKIIYK